MLEEFSVVESTVTLALDSIENEIRIAIKKIVKIDRISLSPFDFYLI